MNSEQIKEQIRRDAKEVSRLHLAVHSTFKRRDESEQARKAWSNAAEEFSARYDQLAFPGGYEGALSRIEEGEPLAVESAICFLEIRPFFFRSGFMFKDILRKCRKAPLTQEQAARLAEIEKAVVIWRQNKRQKQIPTG